MNAQVTLPRLYRDLADWWPLLSAPEDYEEEAAWYREAMVSASEREVRTVLELGSGGGNNASHLKHHFEMTLVDRSPTMLAVSQELNPACEHVQGDMRSVRLGRQFDAVFVHDAVVYMTTEEDLQRAMETAYVHCAPGGVALFAPDYTRETFRERTEHGGENGAQRSLRYLDWTWDPDPTDSTYRFVMVYVLRQGERVEVVEDLHVAGLFGEADWIRLLAVVGFRPRALPFEHSDPDPVGATVFLGVKPSDQRA